MKEKYRVSFIIIVLPERVLHWFQSVISKQYKAPPHITVHECKRIVMKKHFSATQHLPAIDFTIYLCSKVVVPPNRCHRNQVIGNKA